MPQPLGEITDPEQIQTGIWKSVDALKSPLWVDGQNVTFRKGQVEKARGYTSLCTAAASVNAIAQANVAGAKRAYLGTSTALYYSSNGGAPSALRTGLTAGQWSLLPWGNYLLASNGQNKIQLWPNTGSAADISDSPTSARIIKPLNVFVVGFDCDGTEGRIRWCDRGNPNVWTVDPANLAGGDYVRNISSKIRCAEPFAGGIAFWSADLMYILTYIGGSNIMSYKELNAKVGAAGINSVAVVGNMCYGVEERGFWRSDGINQEWIAKPMMQDYFSAQIDFSAGDEITCHYDAEYECVEWHWKNLSGGYDGWAYHLPTRSWAPRNWKLTAAQGGSVFGKPIGANGTAVLTLSSGVNAASSPLESYVQTKPLAWGSTDLFKWIDEFRMRKSGSAILTIGLLDEPDGTPEWLTPETLTERHYPNREAAFWVLKISSTALDADWSWAGCEVFGEMGGSRL